MEILIEFMYILFWFLIILLLVFLVVLFKLKFFKIVSILLNWLLLIDCIYKCFLEEFYDLIFLNIVNF